MNTNDFTSTQLAIIALLTAKDIHGKDFAPIPGRIHLIKEVFAFKKTDIGNGLLDELEFEPDNFGPFDETIFAAIDELNDAKLVKFVKLNRHSKIELTEKGKDIANEIWKKLRNDIKAIIEYIKVNFNHISSEKLLDKIYSLYPEMAKNSVSKVAKKYQY
ncbi:MAG: hypothetical protein CHKLHMKO_00514 [Candidatus Argoarchaeum ethanivorans]|uniref:HTH marR-type domain-containing protein n=1 Tax=Candidatus Argoarchaeum ethanivorans TaxID=2608793 RepID=A0A811TBF2_9EURY|nr:MAG: hypothetical protein CHKLHMKO_00514 [Candidatus Argoarchaeum ethanivorans]